MQQRPVDALDVVGSSVCQAWGAAVRTWPAAAVRSPFDRCSGDLQVAAAARGYPVSRMSR